MAALVTTGALLSCTFGTAPGSLAGISRQICLAEGKPAAVIQDTGMNIQITSFGMCTSLANPRVAAATAAALGVLMPQPCMVAAGGTWIPTAPSVLIGGAPCLTSDSQLMCAGGMGMITVTDPGQMKVII